MKQMNTIGAFSVPRAWLAKHQQQHLGAMRDLHATMLRVMAEADIANERETVRVEQFFFALEAHRRAFFPEPHDVTHDIDRSARNKNWKPFDPA